MTTETKATIMSTVAVTFAAGAALFVGSASAQSVASPAASVDMFSRSRNVAVQSRPRPDYEALGIHQGAFLVYPRLEVVGEYNDNIYAKDTGEVDDTILHVRPEISIESDWSQNFLTGYARGSFNRYDDNHSENTDEWAVGAAGRLDVMRGASLAAGVDYNSGFEPRTSPTAPSTAVEPVSLDVFAANLSGSRAAGRIKLSGRADFRQSDYEDGVNGLGGVIDQDYRDKDVASLSGRIDYAVSPDTAFFFQATGNKRDFDSKAATLAQPERDSDGYEYVVGASFELGALVRGEVAVGYIEQNFDETLYSDISGLGGHAQLEWFASELTTLTLSGGRTIEDGANPSVGGFGSTNLNLRVDHELLRNLVVNASVAYGKDNYEDIDRDDERLGGTIGATYFVNRYVGVSLAASTTETTSDGLNADIDYTVNKLSLSLVSQF